jgi:hypothetical protein
MQYYFPFKDAGQLELSAVNVIWRRTFHYFMFNKNNESDSEHILTLPQMTHLRQF